MAERARARAASPRTYRVGVTGHRTLGSPEAALGARVRCHELLARARAEHGRIAALTALAEGADTLFAEEALLLRIPLHVVVPFRGVAEDFAAGPPRRRYDELLALASRVTRLQHAVRSDDAYYAGGRWIADRADLLIALWDGEAARGHGGTAEVVEYARRRGVCVEVIPVER
jgi:hypothetical protein